MKGLGRTPSLGDRRGFMPPQLKTKQERPTFFYGVICQNSFLDHDLKMNDIICNLDNLVPIKCFYLLTAGQFVNILQEFRLCGS